MSDNEDATFEQIRDAVSALMIAVTKEVNKDESLNSNATGLQPMKALVVNFYPADIQDFLKRLPTTKEETMAAMYKWSSMVQNADGIVHEIVHGECEIHANHPTDVKIVEAAISGIAHSLRQQLCCLIDHYKKLKLKKRARDASVAQSAPEAGQPPAKKSCDAGAGEGS